MENDKKSGRFTIDCSESGKDCSLKLTGTYDEVLETGVDHCIKSHGMQGDPAKVREDVVSFIKPEGTGAEADIPASRGRGFEGRGEQSGRSPGLTS